MQHVNDAKHKTGNHHLINYLTKEALSSSRDIQATALTGDVCPGITRWCLPFNVQIWSILSYEPVRILSEIIHSINVQLYLRSLYVLLVFTITNHFPQLATADTQSSCIRQSFGSGEGYFSKYSISTTSSMEPPLSWICSTKEVRRNCEQTKKSNSSSSSIRFDSVNNHLIFCWNLSGYAFSYNFAYN